MIATAIRIAVAVGLGGMAGLLGGLFGVGGGFLVIPLLGFFYGMDQQTAQGTVLIMVVPNVVWAFSRYRRRFGIDLRMAATIAGSALIATYPTARLATGRRAANQPDSKSMTQPFFGDAKGSRSKRRYRATPLSIAPAHMAPDRLPASLEAASTIRVLASGELLFRQGDPAAAIYRVESGRLRLIRRTRARCYRAMSYRRKVERFPPRPRTRSEYLEKPTSRKSPGITFLSMWRDVRVTLFGRGS
jgi:hypothetical protein